ncbi:MAG: hypothetical protein PHT99_07210 [Methanoregula sp.]|nr:hypothetical protein [Methanoregula sp.]
MTAKKGQGVTWRETSVAIREDILDQVQASGLDIGEVCNRALADAAGIRYVQKPAGPAAPVIIAHDGAPAGDATIIPPTGIHPVINADDPRAATTVKQVPRPSLPKIPAALPGRVSTPEKPQKALPPVPHPEKPGKPVETKGKGSAIKKFIAEAIVREDADENCVSKDLLYQAFTRWCRERRITPIPDRRTVTVTLKNQFAMKEKTAGGEPSWVNVRLK